MPVAVLGDSIKLAIEPSPLIRDNILDHFTKSIIADPTYYDSFPNKAANFTKLIYALVFLVAQCNGRQYYGSEGWSGRFIISVTDLETALNFLALVMKNHDGIKFETLHYLLSECTILNRIMDTQDKRLFGLTLSQICNENLLMINRYKFSSSPDFFAPNKILHKDFVAFIRELPVVQNYEVFNLSENTEIKIQETEAKYLIQNFNLTTRQVSETKMRNDLAKCVELTGRIPETITVPTNLSLKHSTFIIKEQIEAINTLLTKISEQLKRLESQLKGELIQEFQSEELLATVTTNRVPYKWKEKLDLSTDNLDDFINRLSKVCTYYRYVYHIIT